MNIWWPRNKGLDCSGRKHYNYLIEGATLLHVYRLSASNFAQQVALSTGTLPVTAARALYAAEYDLKWFYNCDIIWASWRIKSAANRLFVKQPVQTDQKRNHQHSASFVIIWKTTGGFQKRQAMRWTYPCYGLIIYVGHLVQWPWHMYQNIMYQKATSRGIKKKCHKSNFQENCCGNQNLISILIAVPSWNVNPRSWPISGIRHEVVEYVYGLDRHDQTLKKHCGKHTLIGLERVNAPSMNE